MKIQRQLLISLFLISSWYLAWLVYKPGLQGPFLFDDFPNLEKIGAFGPIDTWELFWAYISSGFSGPSGRPIALVSFLINANDWPADPESFKRTNVLIHLLIGIILFPTIRKLLSGIGRPDFEAQWTALIATALWLLNPFLVSTTLYVVQRMTQLAALFIVIGIYGYLQGRLWLPTRPRLGYATLSFSVVLATVLAIFSKENGALLPLLILTIEFALHFHWTTPGPDWRWKIVFLGLPALAVIGYLLMSIPGAERAYAGRAFSLDERILTEPRILLDYLFHLIVPHIQTQGLYQDGIVFSTGLFIPWTTLPAILGIIALGIGGWIARQRYPLLSLAILFFFAGHLIESTVLGLELYFEHRNYFPAIFLFLPIASGIMTLRSRIKPILVTIVALGFTSGYAAATWQRASIWGDENQLMLVWAATNPYSPRAQNSAAQAWLQLGHPELAIAHLEQSIKNLPDSSLLTGSYISLKAYLGILSADEFRKNSIRLRHQPFDAQMLGTLKQLVEIINASAPLPEYTKTMMLLLEGIRNDLQGRIPLAQRYTYYLQGLLLSGQKDADGAYQCFDKALSYYNTIGACLDMVSILAKYKHFQRALDMLNQCDHVLEANSKMSLQHSTYQHEIARLRTNLQEDMGSQQQKNE